MFDSINEVWKYENKDDVEEMTRDEKMNMGEWYRHVLSKGKWVQKIAVGLCLVGLQSTFQYIQR